MAVRPRDPLLTAARIVIGFCIILGAIVIAAALIAFPAALLHQDQVLAELVVRGVHTDASVFGALGIILVCLAGFAALTIWFLILLRRIVDTVGEGDPFVPINADRLSRMGWITVATQVLSIPAKAMLLYFAELFKDAKGIHIEHDVGISGGAIVLILVLFILARVFRHGTAMRDDLEGTV